MEATIRIFENSIMAKIHNQNDFFLVELKFLHHAVRMKAVVCNLLKVDIMSRIASFLLEAELLKIYSRSICGIPTLADPNTEDNSMAKSCTFASTLPYHVK